MINWQEIRRPDGKRYKRARMVDGWMVWTNYGPGRAGELKFRKELGDGWDDNLDDLA